MKRNVLLTLVLASSCMLAGCVNNQPTTSSNPNESVEHSSPIKDTSTPSTPAESTPEMTLPIDKTPTIFLAGDSTVKTYNDNQYIAGWGQYLNLFLKDGMNVVNCANGGRSSRSFINEGRLYNIEDSSFNYNFSQNDGNSIEDSISEGDYLFIQFGHNDDNTKLASTYTTIFDRMVPLGEPDSNGIYPTTPANKVKTTSLPSAYTELANDNEESKALEEIAKYGSEYYAYDSGGTYKWYLKQYIDFARSKNATPVLITPVARVKFSDGSIIGGAGLHGENFAYVEAVRQLANEENCLLIDLFKESKIMLETATPAYANYLMALKPNDLVGSWPVDYDSTYGNVSKGYTGIEATHYNKYGAFLQAGKIAEYILNYDNDTSIKSEYFDFKDNVLSTPSSYVDPSNLIGKTVVESIEELFEKVSVTNPNRTYKLASDVITLINTLNSRGDVTKDNYLAIKEECESIRNEYYLLNIDDRDEVSNLVILERYEQEVKDMEDTLRPKPISTVSYGFEEQEIQTITSTMEVNGLKLVATADKKMDIKKASATITHNGVEYSATKALSLGGKASFNSNRYVEFTVDGKCSVTIVAKSSGSDDRVVDVRNSSNTSVGQAAANASVSVTTIELESAGTYMAGSAGSGIYIYFIIIEYFE